MAANGKRKRNGIMVENQGRLRYLILICIILMLSSAVSNIYEGVRFAYYSTTTIDTNIAAVFTIAAVIDATATLRNRTREENDMEVDLVMMNSTAITLNNMRNGAMTPQQKNNSNEIGALEGSNDNCAVG
jgi:hypothetical protein